MQYSETKTPLFDGILVINKPAGPTSHDVVNAIRTKFGFGKVGHGGTLDPQATGTLVILIGKATKLSDKFINSDKIYQGTMRLGIETDSYDSEGIIIKETNPSSITIQQIRDAMNSFKGDIYQIPPMTSAIKIKGVPLYKLAHKGETVERKPKLVHIYEFRLLSFNSPDIEFIVRCSKGTYVRTLCHDVGKMLGCGAHLTALCRMAAGNFTLSEAIPFHEVIKMDIHEIRKLMIPLSTLNNDFIPQIKK